MNSLRYYINLIEEKEQIMEASREDIAKTLFSLAKYNEGKFKSDKQKNFLLSQTDEDGVFMHVSHYSFGTSSNKQHQNAFYFFLDDTGVNKITKGTDGRPHSLYWERTEKFIQKNKEQNAKRAEQAQHYNKEELVNALKGLENVENEIKQIENKLQDELNMFDSLDIPDDIKQQIKKGSIESSKLLNKRIYDKLEMAKERVEQAKKFVDNNTYR